MNILLKLKFVLTALIISVSVTFVPVVAHASNNVPVNERSDVCQGIGEATGSDGGCTGNSGSQLGKIIKYIISIMSLLVGVIAVIMIIVSAMKFMTSGGDPNGVKSARNTLIYALIGVVVAALAQVLIHFVLFQASGGNSQPCPTDSSIKVNNPHCNQ